MALGSWKDSKMYETEFPTLGSLDSTLEHPLPNKKLIGNNTRQSVGLCVKSVLKALGKTGNQPGLESSE